MTDSLPSETPLLRTVESTSPDFDALVHQLEHRGETDLEAVEASVRGILRAVRAEGDRAVLRFVEQFEKRQPAKLFVRDYGGAEALASLEPSVRSALEFAVERVRRYHEQQAQHLGGFEHTAGGVTLASRVLPLARVGIYVPGGKARYPSSVVMSAVIAHVAGVREIIVASPDCCPEVRAACHLAGVHALLDAGGAQAVAALTYGTESVPRVDKIVGPGNIYVAAAKRLVYGEVAIDSIAGPSEILVIADESASAPVVAADLLSQAEHDEAAYPLLLTTSRKLVAEVERELAVQLAALPRQAIAAESLRRHGAALIVGSRQELSQIATLLAVEHVAVQVNNARELAATITSAGALFVGHSTPEAAGDYVAGPSHVLPTGGAARFSAPLGVYDFVARSSVIEYSSDALAAQAGAITALARTEGLEAHARAVEARALTSRED